MFESLCLRIEPHLYSVHSQHNGGELLVLSRYVPIVMLGRTIIDENALQCCVMIFLLNHLHW